MGQINFLNVADGSSSEGLEVVVSPSHAKHASRGSATVIGGTLKPHKKNGIELHAASVEVAGQHDAESYPVQKAESTLQYYRTMPHLRYRDSRLVLLLKLRSRMLAEISTYMDEHEYVQVHTPIITSSDCEGAGEVFQVTTNVVAGESSDMDPGTAFFRAPKYLTVSAQLHLEALAAAVEKVWTISPTFRAERSDTPRHLSEFYMLEAEISFVSTLDPLMDFLEHFLRTVACRILDDNAFASKILDDARSRASRDQAVTDEFDIDVLEKRWSGLRRLHWPRITYDKAIQLLEDAHSRGIAKFDFAPSWQDGLQAEHERYVALSVGHGSPVFVTDYPKHQKPFYMSPSSGDNDRTVACFDLLVPELGELAGGSLREHRLHELMQTMEQKGIGRSSEEKGASELDVSSPGPTLEWYLDLRRYGSVPHGGFGLGFDRLLCYISGVGNVRDMVTFPRHYGRCDA